MSTLKVDALSSKTTNTNLTITADGSGLVDIETGFKVSGTAGFQQRIFVLMRLLALRLLMTLLTVNIILMVLLILHI